MSRETESLTIPVVEEELKVDRNTIETGHVRVRTVTQERTEEVSETLHRTDIEVDRVPVGREVAEVPPVREEGDVLVIPVVEERLVRRLFLTEEVHVRRQTSTMQVQEPVKLRSQQVVVEREQGSGKTINQE